MNLFTGESSDEYFGSDAPPAVRRLLAQAANAVAPNEREALLWTAQATAPECLAVYYLLYKFHAQRREFEQAETAARKGLVSAARQAGLPPDWSRELPLGVDFSQPGPARFWLFTLKALAFISLRHGHSAETARLLARIEFLDPQQSVGGDVIAALLRSARGGDEGGGGNTLR